MDKNLVLAVVLSVAVYLGWFKFLEWRYGKPSDIPVAAQASISPGSPEPELKGPKPERPAQSGGLDGSSTFHVSDLQFKVQPLGGGLVSYDYPGPLGRVELVEDPFPGYFAAWPELRFERAGTDEHWPAFEARLPSGVIVRKEYNFSGRDGMKTLRFTFTNPGKAAAAVEPWNLALGPGLGTVESERKENAGLWGAVALTPAPEGKTREAFTEFKLSETPGALEGPWLWAGVANRYFLAAVFPPPERFARVVYGAKGVDALASSWFGGQKMTRKLEPWLRLEAKAVAVPAGGSVVVEVPFYFGPKSFNQLSALGKGLERSVSFGWFTTLGRFTLKVLNLFHRWTGNWGWSIVMLTLCLQAVLLPLSYKQMKSMAGMKKVQPELQKIQQKFAKDPQRLQAEMMEVYKKHGVNPLGGCAPIVLQMPIFVSLFNMLRNNWELHGAPWMFWIRDLSAHDPFYVLPLLMGGIMFLQNKLNPQPAADPAQAQMMTVMPVVMTFMFLSFPSGLVLYWLTNSLIGFASQMAFKRRLEA